MVAASAKLLMQKSIVSDIYLGGTMNDILLEIAKKHLFVETLETRKSDRLDFHNVSVWNIKTALEEAFKAGYDKGVNHD